MKLTVCIPHYRAVDSLHRLLGALDRQQAQSFDPKHDIKVIVINDDLVVRLDRNEFVYNNLDLAVINQANAGAAAARNTGMKKSLGEYILYLDADSTPSINWIEVMWRTFEDNPEVDAIGGQVYPFPKKGIINEYYNLTNRLRTPIFDNHTGEVVTIITANCGFRLDALRGVGGFDEEHFSHCKPGGEDVDLTYRLKQNGHTIRYEPSAICYHEYPTAFATIFTKYANYGRGMRIFCLARGIDPKSIRQPRLKPLSFFMYLGQVFPRSKKSFLVFRTQTSFARTVVFTFFDIIRYYAHTYGYFFKH